MTDTVDLMVVGVESDISRADMSDKLVKKFKQEAYSFEALLDGAYGESAPYAAQTGVERALAEQGKDQLEAVGLICQVIKPGEVATPRLPEKNSVAANSVSAIKGGGKDASHSVTEFAGSNGSDDITSLADDINLSDDEIALEDSALASFKGESEGDDSDLSDLSDLAFDVDEADAADSALASFKKTSADKTNTDIGEIDFSDDIEAVGVENVAAVGLADAKNSKNNISDIDDPLGLDFSDQIEDAEGDELTLGLKEARDAKPEFSADASELDFNSDFDSIGAATDKDEVPEETAEHDLSVSPNKQDDDGSVDFSGELEGLAAGAASVTDEPVADEPGAMAEKGGLETAQAKTDVPDALVNATGGDLDVELIDPAPIEKVQKAPVEIDDGGLSLSVDNDTPLTDVKEKSDTQAPDDGGLSLSSDDSAPLTMARVKPASDAADDDDLSLSTGAVAAVAVEEPAVEPEVPASTGSPDDAPELNTAESVATDVTTPEVSVDELLAAVESVPSEPLVASATDSGGDSTETLSEKVSGISANESVEEDDEEEEESEVSGGLVLPGQLSSSLMPKIIREDDLDDPEASAVASLRSAMPSTPLESAEDADIIEEVKKTAEQVPKKVPARKGSKKRVAVALAGATVLAGGGVLAFMNADALSALPARFASNDDVDYLPLKDSTKTVEKVKIEVAELQPGADLESLSTGDLLVNLSDANRSNSILNLEPYFLESGNQVKRRPTIGAAVPAESGWMVRNRKSHPADKYFDDWSNRDSDLSLFLALLDNLIEKGDLEVAQQLSDRAKDKLFSVMSAQRLARAYSDAGENAKVNRLMSLATRDTYAIKAPEERVLALSDYAFTEQEIGLNENAMDTFLKVSILARSLVRAEARTVGLSAASIYFQRSGRNKQAQELLEQAMQASNDLPRNTAARDLAIRYVALSEARMGLFNQALEHTKLIVDPFATVSAYHGIALAIESTGDDTNARKVLNMAYRAGSLIEDKDERSKLLSQVILASEME